MSYSRLSQQKSTFIGRGRQGFSHAGGAYYFVTELLMWESGGAGEALPERFSATRNQKKGPTEKKNNSVAFSNMSLKRGPLSC